MPETITYTGRLTVVTCGVCSIRFALPEDLYRDLNNGKKYTFWCPSGHCLHFCTTDLDEAKKELKKERLRRERYERECREQLVIIEQKERQIAAHKGVATKRKKTLDRVIEGVCPCCNRFFKNVHRHMRSKHPEVVESR